MPTARLTVRDLMIVVGLICVILGAFRFHFSLGCFVSGTIAIAAMRTSEKLRKARSGELPDRNLNPVWIFGRSLVIASILLTTSLTPGLLVLPSLIWPGCTGPRIDPVLGVMLLAGLGWPISVAMRRLMW